MAHFGRFVIAAAAFAAMSGSALAQPGYTVTAKKVTLSQWGTNVSRALDKNLYYPPVMTRQSVPQGVVAVKFLCSDSGAPDRVAVWKSSGVRSLDNAALRAVRGIKSLHPLPEGMGHDQGYVAMILFADSVEWRDRKMKSILAEADRQNASFANRDDANATAMLVGLLPPG